MLSAAVVSSLSFVLSMLLTRSAYVVIPCVNRSWIRTSVATSMASPHFGMARDMSRNVRTRRIPGVAQYREVVPGMEETGERCIRIEDILGYR